MVVFRIALVATYSGTVAKCEDVVFKQWNLIATCELVDTHSKVAVTCCNTSQVMEVSGHVLGPISYQLESKSHRLQNMVATCCT